MKNFPNQKPELFFFRWIYDDGSFRDTSRGFHSFRGVNQLIMCNQPTPNVPPDSLHEKILSYLTSQFFNVVQYSYVKHQVLLREKRLKSPPLGLQFSDNKASKGPIQLSSVQKKSRHLIPLDPG